MLFNSYIFIFLFLPVVLLGYYGLHYAKLHKLALLFLTFMSMWFCAYTGLGNLTVLLVNIFVNFILVEMIARVQAKQGRKVILFVGLLWNIGILFYYKYFNFFAGNINEIFESDITLLDLALPLGISFYVFQQLAYLIDSYRGDCEKYGLLEFAAYSMFFPKLIQGPLAGHVELIAQLRDEANHTLDYNNLSKGIYAFALGLAKKVLLADTLAKIVAIGYRDIPLLNTPSAFLVMVCYSLQLYFDFSGYCDMAYGIGLFFHVELPFNFNSPYKATSIMDFWDRWHITLTKFFTKYVYIPLGGNRRGTIRTYVNVWLVFLISGLWHGANWTFVLWGAIHGLFSVIERFKLSKAVMARIPNAVKMVVTFILVTFLWSLFRAESVTQAMELWNRLFHAGWGEIYAPLTEAFHELIELKVLYRLGLSGIMTAYPSALLLIFIITTLLACIFMKNTQEKVLTMKLSDRKIVVIVVLMVWSILSLSEVSEFLYVNF